MNAKEPIEVRLARHAPDQTDTRRLERSRRMLDDAIFLEDSGVSLVLGQPEQRPARRRLWRLAVPVAAAVGLGIGIAVWPSPAITPSTFADWNEQPEARATTDPRFAATVENCRAQAASHEFLVYSTEGEQLLAAEEAERALTSSEAERESAQEAASQSASANPGDVLVVAPEGDVVMPVTAWDGMTPAVVDSRGSWTVAILVEDLPQLGGTDVDPTVVRTELTCMAGPSGATVTGLSVTELSLPIAQDASLISFASQEFPSWTQMSGFAGTATDRVVVTLEDGTEVDATVTGDQTSSVSTKTSATGLQSNTFVTGVRSWLAWWPTDAAGQRAVSVTTYLSDGTVGQTQKIP